jgi:hypothetical protein
MGFEPMISASARPQTYDLRQRGHWDRRSVRVVGQNIQTLTLCFGCNVEEEKLYKRVSFTAK